MPEEAAVRQADLQTSTSSATAPTVERPRPEHDPLIEADRCALAITDEASPFALRSTRNHPRTAVHRRCQSQAVKSCRDEGAGVRSIDGPAGPLPEICQKLLVHRDLTRCSGVPGARHRPRPDFSDAGLASCAGLNGLWLPLLRVRRVVLLRGPIGGSLARTAKLRQRTCRDVRVRWKRLDSDTARRIRWRTSDFAAASRERG